MCGVPARDGACAAAVYYIPVEAASAQAALGAERRGEHVVDEGAGGVRVPSEYPAGVELAAVLPPLPVVVELVAEDDVVVAEGGQRLGGGGVDNDLVKVDEEHGLGAGGVRLEHVAQRVKLEEVGLLVVQLQLLALRRGPPLVQRLRLLRRQDVSRLRSRGARRS